MIESADWFMLNGVSSETIPDIYVDTPSVPPMAKQRYTRYQTGADEDGVSPDNTFEDLSYPITFYTFNRKSFDNSDIYKFLANPRTLQISRLNGFYFKVNEIEVGNPENVSGGLKIRYNVNFRLAPFKYRTSNPEIAVTSGSIVTNTGTRYSRPIFRITGTGDIKLNVNGEVFEINGLSDNQQVTIDSSRYITYSGNNLFYAKTKGLYPFLAVGDNLISWEGNISSVNVTNNERCY